MMTRRLLSFCFVCFALFVNAQTGCYETVSLPTDSKWGGGDAVGSLLIGNTYSAGQGPGIYIVADGGYRLYLNGELLAYDNAAGRVRFIPMTFLPMKNVISIVGINGQGAPGVLMHIDELDKTFVTSAAWKANSAPSDNTWKNKTYSDAAWGAASVQTAGSLSQTPSGVAVSGFPLTSTAKWIWSSNASDPTTILRYSFTIKAVGYGQNTTGGDGAAVVVVKTVAELIAQATSASAAIILVPEGIMDCRKYVNQSVCYQTCSDKLTNGGYNGNWITNGANCPGTTTTVVRRETLLWMKSNKTIVGMGRGASLRGIAFYSNATGLTNMIFRNLKIWDVNPHIVEAGDGISLNGMTKLWVDHCTFKWISDGNDIDGTKECTFSWNRWNGYNEYMCTTRDNYSAMIRGSDITYDHQWWEGACGRNPKMYGTILSHTHMINNYHSNNTYYAAESGDVSNLMYIENTHFDTVRFPTVKIGSGVVYCSGNKYTSIGSHVIDWVNSAEPKDAAAKFTPPYTYTLDDVNNVKSICRTYCGAGGKWGSLPVFADAAAWSNTAASISISSPTNGATIINPASVTITASATDADGSIASVAFYSGGTLLGTDNSSPYSLTLTSFATCTYSIVAVATDNSGNATMSWPVTFSISAQAKSYVYSFPANTALWTDAAYWTPAVVPTAAIDTAIIRSGEVKVAADVASVVKVEPSGIFRLTDSISVPDLRLQGGVLKSYTSNPVFILSTTLNAEKASTVMVGSVNTSFLYINGTIKGSGNLTKTSLGTLRINASAAAYKGTWIVSAGRLQLRSADGLGLCGVEVDSAANLDIEAAASTNALVLKNGGTLNLDANFTVQAAVFGNQNIPAGTYTAANYPTFITGTGTLSVAKSLLSIGAPSTGSITLTSNAGATYNWSNGTSNVASTAAYTATVSGSYIVTANTAAGCAITSAPVSVQIITLAKGWNLFSINLRPSDSTIATLFAGLDVQEIKDMNTFWRKAQVDAFNSLQTITPGEGYFANMNIAGKLLIAGMPVQTRFIASPEFIASLQSANWKLIGCPYQTTTPFSQDFNATNCSVIKDFTGFWIPNGTANSLQNFEVGKGYFIKK